MNSRERVWAALSHKEGDRVPVDFGAMPSTGIMAMAYGELRRYLGCGKGRVRVYDFSQQLAEPEPEILERFGVDVVDLRNTSILPDNRKWISWTLPDGQEAERPADVLAESDGCGGHIIKDSSGQVIARMPKGSFYFTGLQPALGEPPKPLEEYTFSILQDDYLEMLETRAQWFRKNTEYAVMVGFGGSILELCQGQRGWGNFMMDLAADPEFAGALMDKALESHLRNLERFLGAVGDTVDVIQMGDDLGTQQGPQLSPEMYHEMIYPRHKQVYQYVHAHSKAAVFLHSCGGIRPLLPDLIDAGVQALNPVQTSAAGMDPAELKAQYGNRLTFWGGGCDTQSILPRGTPEQIDAHVRERISIFAPGGGFVFCQVHNIQAKTPPRNVVAMFEAVAKYRDYPDGWKREDLRVAQ